jgi:hypothetical protein
MRRALLLLALAPVAAADHEETERRLKTAGVDPALRARIHASIRSGAGWLAAEQRADRTFDGSGRMVPLCGLALQHAGVAGAEDAYRNCLALMLGPKGDLKEAYYRGTYEGGLTALLLLAEGKHEGILKRLGAAFEHGEAGAGFWGYSNAQGGSRGAGNLSTSQFGALALWAAGRAGFETKPELWERHVAYLLRSQTPDGSFGYGGPSPSYPTGTFMGLANLIVAQRALGERADEALAARIAAARERAEGVLARDVRGAIVAFRRGIVRDYYALYAMEKACLFLDREEIGRTRWYVEGAEALLAAQREDGRWSGDDYRYWLSGSRAAPGARDTLPRSRSRDLEATAFALLFLLRSWETFHPTTPRRLHTPPTTPGSAPPPADAPPSPPPVGVPLALAEGLLAELSALLDAPGATNDALVRSVGRVADAYGAVRGSADEVDGWRCRAEALLLRALGLARGAGKRRPVHVAAADALGRTHPRVSGEMRRLADRTLLPAARDDADASLPEALFSALAGLRDPDSLAWMIEEHFVSGGSRAADLRCRAALRAAPRFDAAEGRLRHAAVERLVRAYAPMERAEVPSGTWTGLGPAVILATQHFASDADGLPPRSTGVEGGWIFSMREFETWWRDHDRLDRPPWRD